MPSAASLLCDRGYDFLSSRDVGADGEIDDQQFERARADGRAIVTYNERDFKLIAAREAEANRPHSGIIVSAYQYSRDQTGFLVSALQAFIDAHPAEGLANSLQYLPRSRSG